MVFLTTLQGTLYTGPDRSKFHSGQFYRSFQEKWHEQGPRSSIESFFAFRNQKNDKLSVFLRDPLPNLVRSKIRILRKWGVCVCGFKLPRLRARPFPAIHRSSPPGYLWALSPPRLLGTALFRTRGNLLLSGVVSETISLDLRTSTLRWAGAAPGVSFETYM